MKLSIITVVLNNVLHIKDCIESVGNQTHKEIEYIIVDGGSTDGTLQVIKNNCDKVSKLLSEADRGIYDAMNKGIQIASGDVIGVLNSDDFYPNPKIISKVSTIFQHNSINSCYGDLQYVDPVDTGRVIRSWRSGSYQQRRFYWGWMPPHPTFFAQKEVFEKFGAFNLDLGSAADYELMLRFLIKHKITTAYIPEVLVKMRMGGVSNASFKNRMRAHRMDQKAWEVNALRPFPWTLWLKPLRKLPQFFFHKGIPCAQEK
jgi:glycosyltransferase involved in cell wall biosynthesis